MRVPLAERQVGIETARIPKPTQPNAVPAAFGVDIGRAVEQFGAVSSDLSDALAKHVYKRQQETFDAQTADLETQAGLQMQDILLNDQAETVKINGKDVERPKGILKRTYENADNSTFEYDDKFNKLKENILGQAPSKEHAQKLSESLDKKYLQYRSMVIKNETEQANNVNVRKQVAYLDQQVSEAADNPLLIEDEGSLKEAIEKARDTQERINELLEVNPEDWEKKKQEAVAQIVEKPILKIMETSGNAKSAKELLNEVKNSINKKTYKSIEKAITDMNKLQVKQLEEDVNDGIINGTISVDDILELNKPQEQGGIGSTKAKKYINAIEKIQSAEVKSISKDSKKIKKYVDMVDKLIDDRSEKFELKQYAVDVMSDGVINNEEARNIRDVKDKLKDLKFNRKSGLFNSAVKKVKDWFNDNNPNDEEIIDSINTIIGYGKNLDFKEEDIEEFSDDIIKAQQKKINSNAGKYKVGDIVNTPLGSAKVVGFYPDGEPDVEIIK